MRATWLAIGLTALIASSASGQFSEQQAPYGRGYQPRARATFGYPTSHSQVNYPGEEAEAAADEGGDEASDSGQASDYERVPAGDSGYSDGGYSEGGYPGEYCGDDGCCADGCCPIDGCDAAWSGPGCGKGRRCPPPCEKQCCGPSIWVNVDFMALWLKGDKLPPLVTTSDAGTSEAQAGVNGLPSTHVLFGDGRVNRDFRPGGRVQTGMWFNAEQTIGIDGHFYQVATATQRFYSQSNFNSPDPNAHILALPFTNGATGAASAAIVAYPPVGPVTRSGNVTASASSSLMSAGGGGRFQLWGDCYGCNRIYAISGYRFFRLDEDLTMRTNTLLTNTLESRVTGLLSAYDRFGAQNIFNGSYIGTLVQVNRGPLWAWVAPQIALGNMRQIANISGATGPGFGTPTVGHGLLTGPNNVGHHQRDHFAYIPEVDAKIGYSITPNVMLTLGYNFTFISSVVRPGTVINPVVGGGHPTFAYNATSLWMQAATAGFQIRY